MNPVQSNQQINDPGNFTLLSRVAIFLPAWLCFWQLDIKLWPMLHIINWNAISIHGNAAYKRNVTDCFPRKGTNNFVTNPTWGMVHTSTYTSSLWFFSGYYDESIQNLHLNCPTSPSEMWHSSCSRGGTPTGLPVDFKKLTDSQVLLHSIPCSRTEVTPWTWHCLMENWCPMPTVPGFFACLEAPSPSSLNASSHERLPQLCFHDRSWCTSTQVLKDRGLGFLIYISRVSKTQHPTRNGFAAGIIYNLILSILIKQIPSPSMCLPQFEPTSHWIKETLIFPYPLCQRRWALPNLNHFMWFEVAHVAITFDFTWEVGWRNGEVRLI